jgi:hypothetical protein
MAFSQPIAELIAYRSGYICNNPDCNVLTVGPTLSDPALRTKVGEAAHIVGEKATAARYEDLGTPFLASAENGIWLCVSCHTLVDKNKGVDYPKSQLMEWKRGHEELMGVLLRTHQSPLPLVRRHSTNAAIAQDIVDTLAHRGVMFQPHVLENPSDVIDSIKQIRLRLTRCLRSIEHDNILRGICNILIGSCRELMNENSRDATRLMSYLDVLRARCGVQLYRLQQEYGCNIHGPIAAFVRP